MILMIFASTVVAQDGEKKSKRQKKERKVSIKKSESDGPTFKDRKITFFGHLSPVLSSYRSRDAVDNVRLGRRLNFSYGVGAEYHLSPTFSVLSGINFAAGGGKMWSFEDIAFDQDGATDFVVPVKTKMKYKTRSLQIPVLARWTSAPQGDKQNMKMYGQAGLGLNFGMRARASFFNDDADIKERRIDISEDYRNFDMNLMLGAGVIRDWNEKFDYFCGLSFSRGFVNMAKNYDAIRNRAWTIDVGIIF